MKQFYEQQVYSLILENHGKQIDKPYVVKTTAWKLITL